MTLFANPLRGLMTALSFTLAVTTATVAHAHSGQDLDLDDLLSGFCPRTETAPARAARPLRELSRHLVAMNDAPTPRRRGQVSQPPPRPQRSSRMDSTNLPTAPCPDYITRTGQAGPKGQTLLNLIDGPQAAIYHKYLLADSAASRPGMRQLCPNFRSMSESERKQFYIWTMASISRTETTCGTDRRTHQAIRDVTGDYAIGEFQMNARVSKRSWRSTKIGLANCTATNISSYEANAACALDQLTSQMAGVVGSGISGEVYWARLRPYGLRGSPIVSQMKRFSPCFE